MFDGAVELEAAWRSGLRPDPALSVTAWADTHRVLAGTASAEPGRWRTARVPYMAEIMACLSPDHPCTDVVLMKGTQVGGTEVGNNWVGYVIHVAPGPMMLVLPTVEAAKRSSKMRIQPMIDACPVLSERVQEARSRDSGNTVLMKEFQGGALVITGANSGPGLRSLPIRYAFMDEIDAYPADVSGEGDPVALVEKRTDTFTRKKRYKVSTPTEKGLSRIDAEYNASDQRRYYVPCPHCQGKQWLQWEQVRWTTTTLQELACTQCGALSQATADVATCPACGAAVGPEAVRERATPEIERVWYECSHCHGEIGEHHKTAMLAAGTWIAQSPGAGKAAGFHLSALYSPVGWFSWTQAVQEYLRAQNDLENGTELKKVWTNTVLGQVFETPGQRVDEQGLKDRAEDYKLGTVPTGALLLTAGVDVQGDRLEAVVKGWGRGEESWLIAYEQIFGDPAQEGAGSVWERLSDLLDRAWPHESGSTLRILAAGVDTGGHHTHEVYRYCRARERRHTLAIKGHSVAGKPILGRPAPVDISWRGKVIKQGVQLWFVGTDTAKSLLYNRLRLEQPGPGYLHFPVGLPDNYYEQLTAERRVTRFLKGFAKSEWVKADSARNEALDCEVYAYAAAIYAGVSRANWERLEQVLAPQTADLFVGKSQDTEHPARRPFIDPRLTASWLRSTSRYD